MVLKPIHLLVIFLSMWQYMYGMFGNCLKKHPLTQSQIVLHGICGSVARVYLVSLISSCANFKFGCNFPNLLPHLSINIYKGMKSIQISRLFSQNK